MSSKPAPAMPEDVSELYGLLDRPFRMGDIVATYAPTVIRCTEVAPKIGRKTPRGHRGSGYTRPKAWRNAMEPKRRSR